MPAGPGPKSPIGRSLSPQASKSKLMRGELIEHSEAPAEDLSSQAWSAEENDLRVLAAAANIKMKGPAPDTLLAAARALLADGISPVNSSATLLRLGSEYSRIAVKLNVTPHPKLVKACLSCIDEINVRDTVLDIGSVCALLHLLPKFPRLRALRTWRCELSKAAVELLADFLPKIEHIARLDLDMCPAVSSSMEKFLNFPHLTILSLRACELDEVAASSLATALETNNALRALDLWGNRLRTEGCRELLSAIKSSKSLEALCLGSNGVTDEIIETVADVFMRKEIDRAQFELDNAPKTKGRGAKGASAIPPKPDPALYIEEGERLFLRANETLSWLDISWNSLSEQGTEVLLKMQEDIPILKVLKLLGNPGTM
uniref:Uncharacterized protein n=1 Tax=Chrysotila carterae TaxID=13221 RepID=A0A7S4AZN3_CHRCT